MKFNKIIGALVVVIAIGLISYLLLGDAENTAPTNGGSVAVNTEIPAGQEASNTVLAVDDGATAYVIDPAESEVHWRVYRDGPLARLGHSHVISLVEFEGSVALADDPADSVWELSFPVDGLVIDTPELRARYGEEFESVPSEEDKEGTKGNMLTDRVLDGINFPEIRIEGSGFVGSLDDASLPVSIQMLGRTIEQTFPASISITADTVTVTGEYRLTHADLGMEVFSLLGGAMAVGENIDFTYHLVAVAADQ